MAGSALSVHEAVAARLLRRSDVSPAHLAALEEALGHPLGTAVVSTAEHAAAPSVPESVSFLLPQLALASLRPERRVVVLPASLISMENADHPRGIALPAETGPPRYFNPYPRSRYRNASLALVPARAAADLPAAGEAAEAVRRRFPWLLEALAAVPPAADYAAQMCAAVQGMAERWLGGAMAGRVHVTPAEAVAARLLEGWIEAGDEKVTALLFDPAVRRHARVGLDGVPCAWSERRGTFLFWGADPRRSQCVPLREQDGRLVGEGVEVALRADAVAAALRAGSLRPGWFLSLFCLSWLPGLPIAGGRTQASYWPRMIACLDETLGGAGSPERLSVWGYDVCALEGLRIHRGAPVLRLPAHGCGLALAEPPWEAGDVLAALSALEGAPDAAGDEPATVGAPPGSSEGS